MPHGNEHWFYPNPGTQHRAYDFIALAQFGPCSAAFWWSLMVAQKPRLSHTDRRQIRDHTEVASETETPRVRQSLPVAEQDIRPTFELSERFEHGRRFPKREQARHVGKARFTVGYRVLDHSQIGKGQHRHCGPSDLTVRFKAHIDPGYTLEGGERIPRHNACAQFIL